MLSPAVGMPASVGSRRWGAQSVPTGLTVNKWGCSQPASPSDSLAQAHKYEVIALFESQMGSPVPLNPTVFPKLRNI